MCSHPCQFSGAQPQNHSRQIFACQLAFRWTLTCWPRNVSRGFKITEKRNIHTLLWVLRPKRQLELLGYEHVFQETSFACQPKCMWVRQEIAARPLVPQGLQVTYSRANCPLFERQSITPTINEVTSFSSEFFFSTNFFHQNGTDDPKTTILSSGHLNLYRRTTGLFSGAN